MRRLVSRGHEVVATTPSPNRIAAISALGAEPAVMDGLNRAQVMQAVLSSRPEVIVHQMTPLASMRSLQEFDKEFAVTNRLRREGTEHLLAAARAGARKIIVQSYTWWPNERRGSRIKTEDDALDPHPPKRMTESLRAIETLEKMAVGATGFVATVYRYRSLYGAGTSFSLKRRDGSDDSEP